MDATFDISRAIDACKEGRKVTEQTAWEIYPVGYGPVREKKEGEFCNPTVEDAYKAAAAQDRKAFGRLINEFAQECYDEVGDKEDAK